PGSDGDPNLLEGLRCPRVLELLRTAAAHVRERTVDGADHVGERYLLGWPGQQVAALGAASALHDPRMAELRQDVLQEAKRDVLGTGDALALHGWTIAGRRDLG